MNIITCHNKQDERAALHHACRSGSTDMVKLLIEHGGDVMAGDKVSNE